ncbi:MATE family efflux transporter [Planctobacterium marinum]|uniref:MATE family efflux transporter n=2 Tax=Planctobacterium marinum TaxID=1631968 RepID=A0AA48HLK1_9ALTE|nr:MATE family efflux transporter [Planctobacterium marinum]
MSNASRAPNLLEGNIHSTLKTMTIPVVYGMILLMTFGLVDTFFVSLLGTEQLAAISFTFPVTFTVISLNIGLGIGTSATIARLMGAGDKSTAHGVGTGALILSFIMASVLAIIGFISIEPIFTLLGASEAEMPYIKDYMLVWYGAGIFLSLPMVGNAVLRANGDTKTPSMIMALGGAINAILDPILIFGWGPIPAMGIQGAALATLIAWAIGSGQIIHLLAFKRKLIMPRMLSFSELREYSRNILKIGVPAAGANMLTPIANGVMTAIVAGYGSAAVASWGVGGRIESIASIMILALSMTLPPFISQNYGASKINRVKDAYVICLKFVLFWQFAVFLVMWFLAPFIAQIFAQEKEVVNLIQLFLMIVPIGYGLQGIIILTNSSFNAMHKPMSALLLSVIRLFVFFVPISWLGSLLFELKGMFWMGVLANFLTATVAFLWFRKLLNEEMDSISSNDTGISDTAS